MAQRSCLDDDRDKRLRLSQNMQHMEVPPEWSNVPPELKSFKYPGLLSQCKYMYMYVEIQQLDAVKEQMYPQWIVDSEILKCIIRISKILDLGCGKRGVGVRCRCDRCNSWNFENNQALGKLNQGHQSRTLQAQVYFSADWCIIEN